MESSNNAALNINNLTSLEDDNCEIRAKTKQSMGPGVYYVTDVWQDCPDTTANNIRNQEIGINISGYNGNINTVVGKDGCLFDTNDELRYGELTNNNSICGCSESNTVLKIPLAVVPVVVVVGAVSIYVYYS